MTDEEDDQALKDRKFFRERKGKQRQQLKLGVLGHKKAPVGK